MSKQKPGRAIAERPNSDFVAASEGYDPSILKIPKELRDELTAKGLAHRWINMREFQSTGGFHKHDWVPYKSETLKRTASDLGGSGPEGYLIRKELVLAVKPKALQEQHRARIRQKTAIQSQIVKKAANELRESLGPAGAKVYEGYEENEE